ncbi:MAG: hypothetical protein RLZZ252_1179 [Bacteroidota bacterium]|jgi:hypothetical protein
MKIFLNNLKSKTFIQSLLLLLLISTVSGCVKERFFAKPTELTFGADTIWFDTVFTRDPNSQYPISVTRITTIKNKEKLPVKANFDLRGGSNSPFRINVNGFSGTQLSDIEILPGDSLFVFIQCKLTANNQTLPILVLDSLIATVNGANSKLLLAAYGWDAHYMRRPIITANTTWDDNSKPYVIIDTMYVANGSKLTIKPGVQIYASAYTPMYIAGTLSIEGTSDQRVTIRGDKPTFIPSILPNQWTGIHFLKGSSNNKILYADITNASVGVRVDSFTVPSNPVVILENTRIQYCGQICLLGITGAIEATNCLFADAGSYTFLGFLGGNYSFNHCTFAEYSGFTGRQNGSFGFTNTQRDGLGNLIGFENLNLAVYNSIIYGYNKEEIQFDQTTKADFTLEINNNIIRSQNPQSILGLGNIFNQTPKFKQANQGEYALDTLSPAYSKGILYKKPVPVDILGNSRKPTPDLGCFERKQ